ncbi:spore coat putative kinase YutH [Shouchella shacheensis]|uniref:spore coat putative kinase YutH n=1 Tax=Shouchella shacheensis TaxID=1649580 RepID=UPI00073FECB4|nr:spore coat protein YutH [Shouchella shacheensis]
MLERNVYDHYLLYCEERFAVGPYEGFQSGGQSYLLIPKEECATEENEMVAFSSYMRESGDDSVLELVPTRHNQRSAFLDGQEMYVFALPQPERGGLRTPRIESPRDLGGQLHSWHSSGQQGKMKWKKAAVSRWPDLWERRLEQLEEWYGAILNQGPETEVDEAFLLTYPYFMGMAENAIQYAVDTELDVRMTDQDAATICHRRFSEATWLYVDERGHIVKPPTAFIYDHPARDIAEWLREQRTLEGRSEKWQNITTFLAGYEETQDITPFTWQLTYARLVLPLPYFEIIEDYYRSQLPNEKREIAEKFTMLLNGEKENEQFLGELAEEGKIRRTAGMPYLNWTPTTRAIE